MKSHYRLLQLPYESDNKIHHFRLLYRLERGIITDCWISTIFLVVKSSKIKCQSPLSVSGTCQPLRAYMDDLTMTTSVTGEGRLRRLRKVMTDQNLNQRNHGPQLQKNGHIIEKFWFTISGITIPKLKEKPIKSLDKIFNNSMKDDHYHKTINELKV